MLLDERESSALLAAFTQVPTQIRACARICDQPNIAAE
jgi:hypothetical protein